MGELVAAGRRKPGPARGFTVDDVVEAAVALVDDRGVHALTMANVAATLGVTTMALYRYVADKAALVDAVVERIAGGIAPPEAGDARAWDAVLADAFRGLRATVADHPGLGRLICDQPMHAPALAAFVAACVAVLRNAGFDGVMAMRAYTSLAVYTLGFVAWELPRERAMGAEYAATVDRFIAASASSVREELTDVLPALRTSAGDEQFEHGLRCLLDGVAAQRHQGASTSDGVVVERS